MFVKISSLDKNQLLFPMGHFIGMYHLPTYHKYIQVHGYGPLINPLPKPHFKTIFVSLLNFSCLTFLLSFLKQDQTTKKLELYGTTNH